MAQPSSQFLDPMQVLMQARAQAQANAQAQSGQFQQLGAAALPLMKGLLGPGTAQVPQAMPAAATLQGGMDPQTQAALQGLAGPNGAMNMAQQYPWLFGK